MSDIHGKKILVLGGKPIGSTEIVESARKLGLYTIVTDYLTKEESRAKNIADECWDCSVDAIDFLAQRVLENHIDGITAGVHEFCIRKGIELCEKTGITPFCSLEQWDVCSNKIKFKRLCSENGIEVAKTYSINDPIINYPVIVKPSDSDGSRGFSICNNRRELEAGIASALNYSTEYLIEEFIPWDSCIIHYTAVEGEIYFSGISDKISRQIPGGSMVMALQRFPAGNEKAYINKVDEKARQMFKNIGIKNGPIWIEAFNSEDRFIFNEMALRLGGSMTNYPVKYFTGIDQLKLTLYAAVGERYPLPPVCGYTNTKAQYAILPIHVKAGKIEKLEGFETLQKFDFIQALVMVHHAGEVIQSWGTAQQVLCYVHFVFEGTENFRRCTEIIKNTIHVFNSTGQELLYYLMDI